MMFFEVIDIWGRDCLLMVVGNYFFIGKWFKRFIGVGDFDGVYKVVIYL